MSEGTIVNLGREAVLTVLAVAAPMLLSGLLVGLLISLFQATTQIQDQTLAFIPKIVAVLLAVVIFGAWMLRTMMEYTTRLFGAIPHLLH